MDHAAFLEQLGLSDPDEFVERITDAIAEIYRFNADRHEDGLDDHQTFGFNVYRHSWNRVEEALADMPGVYTARPKNSLEITVDGGVRFHLYRGGDGSGFDIHTFDLEGASEIKASLPASNEYQLSLFDAGDYKRTPAPEVDLRELVFVHAGNPRQGLTGLWVGAPRSAEASGTQWAWVLELFRGGEGGGTRLSPDSPVIEPFSSRNEPDLDIAFHDEADEGESGTGAEGAA